MKPEKNWVVYLVRCVDRSLYCGVTNDLKKRLQRHNLGTGAKYTRSRKPVELLAASVAISKSEALKLEYRIKKSPADRKLAILEQTKDIREMGTTQTLQQIRSDLQSVVENLQKLTVSLGRITSAIEKITSEQSVSQKAKRAPVRKKVVVKNGEVVMIKRVPSTKIIFDILSKSDKGLDTTTLMDATGYDQRKVYSVISQLKKKGKIENIGRGVYKAI